MTGTHPPAASGAGPLVSVVIPTHNCAAFIEQTIESVLAQTMGDLEIIVVDDGSSDDTAARLARFGGAIDYLRQGQRGAAAARNAGIARARGAYVAFLDADDLWREDKLEAQIRLVRGHADVGLVFSDAEWFNDGGTLAPSFIAGRDRFRPGREVPPGGTWVGRCFRTLLLQNFITTSTVLIPRDALRAVGVFDESYPTGEDHHLWLRLAARFAVGFVNRPLIRSRMRPESLIGQDFRRMYRNEVRVVQEFQGCFGPLELGARFQIRRRLAELHFRLGWRLFAAGDAGEARREFAAALRAWPLRPRPPLYWALSWVPRERLRALRALRARTAGAGERR
jgi:glycosyltransferase involved in cell wall biosynthesis